MPSHCRGDIHQARLPLVPGGATEEGVCWALDESRQPRMWSGNRLGYLQAAQLPWWESFPSKAAGALKETYQALPWKEFRTSCSQGSQLFLNIFSNKWDFLQPFITMATKLARLVGVFASFSYEICLLLQCFSKKKLHWIGKVINSGRLAGN